MLQWIIRATAIVVTSFALAIPATAVSSQAAATATAASAPVAVHVTDSASPHADLAAARRCYATPKAGVRAVIIRLHKTMRSAPLGQINRGQVARAACSASRGATYSVAGCVRSNWWIRVNFRGVAGWVALGCVRWYATG